MSFFDFGKKNWNNGNKTPDFNQPIKIEVKGIDELEQNLKDAIIENQQFIDKIEADSTAIFNKSELGEEKKDKLCDRYVEFLEKWNDFVDVYEDDSKKKDQKFLEDLKNFKKNLESFLHYVQQCKINKKARMEFLQLGENKDWENIFKEAVQKIVRPGIKKSEYQAKNPQVILEQDFNHDLHEKLEEYLQKATEDTSVLTDAEKEDWRKHLAAAKMIVNQGNVKTCVVLEGITYMTESSNFESKNKKSLEEMRIEAREFLAKKLAEKIKNFCGDKIHGLSGKAFTKKAPFRDMAFMIGKDVVENVDSLDRLEKVDKKSDMSLSAEDEKRIAEVMDNLENKNKDLIYETIIKSYILSKANIVNAGYKKSIEEEQEKKRKNNEPEDANAFIGVLADMEIRELAQQIWKSFTGSVKKGIQQYISERVSDVTKNSDKMDDALRGKIDAVILKKIKNRIEVKAKAAASGNSTANAVNAGVANAEDENLKKADNELKSDDEQKKDVEEEKTREEKMQDFFDEINLIYYGNLKIETFQKWQDKYHEIAAVNKISKSVADKMVQEQMKNDIMDLLSRHSKKSEKELGDLVEFILKKLK